METKTKVIVSSSLAIAVFVLGVAAGWYAKPDVVKTELKVQTVEVEKQVVVVQDKVRVEVVRIKDTQVIERWRKEKTETQMPDGTLTKREVEEKNIETVVKEKENTTEVKVVEVKQEVVVERQKIVEKRIDPVLAQWHLGVMGGINPQVLPTPGLNSWMVGGHVERRVVGPLFLGVWGMGSNTGQGMGGLSVAGEF